MTADGETTNSAAASPVAGGDRHLLRLVVGPDDGRHDAFEAWVAAEDLEHHSPDAFPLFARASAVLTESGIDHPWVPRLRGVARQVAVRRGLHLAAWQAASGVLTQAGIDHLPPLDVALAATPDGGSTLPLHEPRIVVPWERAGDALVAMADGGWLVPPPAPGVGLGPRGRLQHVDRRTEQPTSGLAVRITDAVHADRTGASAAPTDWSGTVPGDRPHVRRRRPEDAGRSAWTDGDGLRWALLVTALGSTATAGTLGLGPTAREPASVAAGRAAAFREATGLGPGMRWSDPPPAASAAALLAAERRAAARLDRPLGRDDLRVLAGYARHRARRLVGSGVRRIGVRRPRADGADGHGSL